MEKKTRKKAAKATEKSPARPIIRSEKGTFLPGSGGGPGRKPQEVEREYLEATMAACSPAQWAGIVEKAVEETKDDDPRVRQMARGFLLKALMGSSPNVVMQYASVNNINMGEDGTRNEKVKGLLPGFTDYKARMIRRKILGAGSEKCLTCQDKPCQTTPDGCPYPFDDEMIGD